jgi:hypothetical protein
MVFPRLYMELGAFNISMGSWADLRPWQVAR